MVTGLKMGRHRVELKVRMHRIKCLICGSCSREKLDFTPSQKARYTKAVVKEAVRLRAQMSITDVSIELGVSWPVVKDAERDYLKRKYRKIDLKDVKNIGIDEVWMGEEYLTIVRDMDSGGVIHVAEGKDGACLDELKRRLDHAGVTIQHVCIDMGNPYTRWVKDNLLTAVIIYDKFHVIKLMNDKLNAIRRETMNRLDDVEKKDLKGKRFLLLMNEEDLGAHFRAKLEDVRNSFGDLGEASVLKECLRRIYKECETEFEGEFCLNYWTKLAIKSGISQLKTMANTITSKMKGIIAYFSTGLTSASMEGFNNKIGWLTRMAYGYRDMEYLKLKIYDLPNLKTRREL